MAMRAGHTMVPKGIVLRERGPRNIFLKIQIFKI